MIFKSINKRYERAQREIIVTIVKRRSKNITLVLLE